MLHNNKNMLIMRRGMLVTVVIHIIKYADYAKGYVNGRDSHNQIC